MKTKNQDEQEESTEDNSDSTWKNKERAVARKLRLNKNQQKRHKES